MKKLVHKDGSILFENISEHPPDEKKIEAIIKKYENKSSKSEMVSVRIPDFLNEMLHITAEKKGISYSDYIRNLLSWPFLVTILRSALKGGYFSSKDSAELSLIEEIQRIDLFLNELKKVRTAEEILIGLKEKCIELIGDYNNLVLHRVLDEGTKTIEVLPYHPTLKEDQEYLELLKNGTKNKKKSKK